MNYCSQTYHANSMSSTKPSKEHEVFVYNIPLAVNEGELANVFKKSGVIIKLSLHSDFRDQGCFAFIRFADKLSVKKAILNCNAHEIRSGRRISVCRSVESRSLVLCGLPRYLTPKEIYDAVKWHCSELLNVWTYSARDGNGVNSGMAKLDFPSHTSASFSKHVLSGMETLMWRKPVQVEWERLGLR